MSKTAKELKQEWQDCDQEDDPFFEQHINVKWLGAISNSGSVCEPKAEEGYAAQDKVQNKYQRKCRGIYIDVYDVLKAFNVTNPATQHAIKKLLAGGERGYKSTQQDYHEAISSIYRAIELDDES